MMKHETNFVFGGIISDPFCFKYSSGSIGIGMNDVNSTLINQLREALIQGIYILSGLDGSGG
ncbi:hypothetical protein ES705_47404 [subsurface metagenome]